MVTPYRFYCFSHDLNPYAETYCDVPTTTVIPEPRKPIPNLRSSINVHKAVQSKDLGLLGNL